jgi:ribosomal protein S24E
MKTINDIKNELLNRRELKIIIEAASTPNFPAISKMISEQFGAGEELIAIKKISGKFGQNSFLIEAFIYKTSKDKEKIETKKKVKAEKKEVSK